MIGINVQITARIANNSLHWNFTPLRSISASDAIRSFAVLVDCMANEWDLPCCGYPRRLLGLFLPLERGMDLIHYCIRPCS